MSEALDTIRIKSRTLNPVIRYESGSLFPFALSYLGKNLHHHHPLTQRPNHTTLSAKPYYDHRTCLPLISSPKLVITTIFLLILTATITYQQSQLCPKTCTCDEQNLEVLCKVPIGASGLPHTLNPNTKRLIINNAQTSQFSGLDYLDRLEIADLAHNKFTLIDFNEISKNSKLTLLNTSHNNIGELKDSSVSEALAQISSNLYYPNGSLDAEVRNEFKKLNKINVIHLILSNNHLTTLRNFTFVRWHRLQHLDLSFNMITFIDSSSLFGLNRLESINLRGNRMIQVPTLALQSTIQSLTITTNSVSPNVKPSSLKIIDLSENAFTKIETDSFNVFEKAQELYLDSCSLESIDEQAFRGLHSLSVLSLQNNHLQEVPSKSFAHLGLLRSLDFNGNNFTSLPPYSFVSLMNLEELGLNNGSFSTLQKGVFEGTELLKRLEISYNPKLTKIERGAFENLPRMSHLSMSSNSLSFVPNDFGDNLSFIDLRGNPLYCGCELKWMTKWLKKFNDTAYSYGESAKSSFHYRSSRDGIGSTPTVLADSNELLNLTCSGPPALVGKLVVELAENKLECLEPRSDLNLHIGFALLFFITTMIVLICLINFCKNEKHLFVLLKENLVQNHITMMLPYSQNLHNNVDLKKETSLHGADYESIQYYQAPIYTVSLGDQGLHHSTTRR